MRISAWRGVTRAFGAGVACCVVAVAAMGAEAPASGTQKHAAAAAQVKPAATKPAATQPIRATTMTADQIIERFVAARGGVAAWKGLQTLSLAGKMDAGRGDSLARSEKLVKAGRGGRAGHKEAAQAAAEVTEKPAEQIQLPFRLEMKRPHKSRMELDFAGKTAVQVFDGQAGWKLRPYLNRDDYEPFTADELKTVQANTDLDSPLMNFAAKGGSVAVEGIETVEGHDAFRLKLTKKDGSAQHFWIDAQSFLDVRYEGVPRMLDGKPHQVMVYQRDFRTVSGLKVPFVYETRVEGSPDPHRMVVETTKVNEPLADTRFVRPQVAGAAVAPAARKP